jgi:hypothetical protein
MTLDERTPWPHALADVLGCAPGVGTHPTDATAGLACRSPEKPK